MKKVLFGLVFCLMSVLGYAQTDTVQNTKSPTGLFPVNEGSLFQTEYVDFGNIRNCDMELLHFTNLSTGVKVSQLKFSFEALTPRGRRIKSSYLTSDEIDRIIKSFNIIQKKLEEDVPDNYVDVSFLSTSGFRVGCYSKRRSWSCYIKLDNDDGESYVWLTQKQLLGLIVTLENAKAKM